MSQTGWGGKGRQKGREGGEKLGGGSRGRQSMRGRYSNCLEIAKPAESVAVWGEVKGAKKGILGTDSAGGLAKKTLVI